VPNSPITVDNGAGGIQLQPDDSGTRLSAGGQVAAVMAKWFWFLMVIYSKLCDFIFVYLYLAYFPSKIIKICYIQPWYFHNLAFVKT
jgi:hypothetical protein